MKKYFRLILVIISTFSLISLLFYRHEYNRLRYVLEVLNFFGKPGEISMSSDCLTEGSLLIENATVTDSVPSWYRLNDELFLYSAFWEVRGKSQQIRTIGVGKKPSKLKVGCRLWYENQAFSSEGRVSYTIIPMKIKQSLLDKEKVSPYFISCSPEVILDATPYAVTYYLDDYHSSELTLSVVSLEYSGADSTNNTVICVVPTSRKVAPAEVMEFIAFHQLLGVTHFLVYDNGLLTPTTQDILKEKSFGYRATRLPWNFPFMAKEAAVTAMKWDCLLRTLNARPAGVLQLKWDQIVVPRYHNTLAALISDFDVHTATSRFILPSFHFCLEYPEEKNGIRLRVLKHFYHADTKPTEVMLERPHLMLQGSKTQQKISQSIIAVHEYIACLNTLPAQSLPPKKYDNSFNRFNLKLKDSKMLQIWAKHQQF